jgi:hypothetical protein
MTFPRLRLLVMAFAATVAALLWLRRGENTNHVIAPAPTPGSTSIATAADAPAPAADALAAFDTWLARYAAAPREERGDIAQEGLDLAKARRAELKVLIKHDPRAALDRAVPMVARQQLPPGILNELEERVNARGFFGVLGTLDGGTAPIHRTALLEDGRRYEAFVFGRRSRQSTTEQAYLNGIAIDRTLALDERPLRVLEAGERPDPSKPVVETCPVSGKSTSVTRVSGELPAITADTPAVEAGGTIHYLCSGGHIAGFEEDVVAGEGSTGGGAGPTGGTPETSNTGPKTHLYIRVTFPDQLTDPQDERACYDMMRQVNDFMIENSFGKCYFITTVTPLLVLPRSTAYYQLDPSGFASEMLDDARVAARAAGYDPSQYDFDTVRYNGGPGGFGGQAYVGGKGCWLKSSSVGVACHEYGHNLGLWHANYWNTSPLSVIGPGTNNEYGNSFDTMGAASAGNNHFGAYNKSVINWLTPEIASNIIASGTYRVFAHDKNTADPARRYALRVRKDSMRDYWLEYRQKFTTNAWMMSGLQLTWDAWGGGDDGTNSGSNGGPQLLDFTPGSPDGKNDAMVVIGRTFSDYEAGVHVTPIGKGGTTPESLDVVVNLGDFPTNQAPTLSVAPSATSVATSTSVTFTATANDPDGDALAYAWDFGDKTFAITNTAVVTKAWGTAGIYNVRCVVSDMKGKVAARSVIVTVGAPGTFTISGTVTNGGVPVEGVLVSNGAGGSSWRGGYTDSNGVYTIPNLAAGSVTVSAQLFGYTFAAGFANPVAVGPNATGKDFTAAAIAQLSVTAPDAVANESGDTGTFRISRTGSTASAATVKVFNPSGTATKSSDYTLAPDPAVITGVSSVYTVTIPAGASFVDVVLTPVNDATAEGPETAILQLVPVAGFSIVGTQSASIVLDDNDTALPRVSITVPDPAAHESGDAGQIVVARTGSTAAALTVLFARTGTAANGTDYADIGTSVVIPAGAASAPINITPLNDTLAEGNETVIVTVSTNAAYVRDTVTAATVTLNDDDINVLTVTATDSTANENGDPGVFTLVRTGNLTNALSVDYTLGGTALHGTDYHKLVGAATFLAGESTVTVTVRPIDDAIGEAAQSIILSLRCNTTSQAGTPSSATVTLSDNDLATISVTPSDGTGTEPATNPATDSAVFRIYRNGGGAAFTANYTVGGTATAGTDYTALTGSVAFAAGDTSRDVVVTPLADADFENTETVTLTLAPNAAYVVEPENTSTVHLVDADQIYVSVSAEDVVVNETSTQVRFYFSRSGSTTAALDVNYVMSGTATSLTDYTGATGVFQFASGVSGGYLTLTPVNDTLAEGTETIVCTITPNPGVYGTRLPSAAFNFGDNDTAGLPQVRFSASSSNGVENTASVNLPVTLSAAAEGTVTVNYTINGGSATAYGVDYRLANGTLQFTPGVTSQSIPITVIDDVLAESAETAVVLLSSPSGAVLGTSSHTYTINDNDTAPLPVVAFTGTSSAAVENVSAPASLLVTLSAVPTSAVSVAYAVTGGTAVSPADFTPAGGTLNFAVGEVTKHLPLTVVNDPDDEGDETLVVTLSSPSGATLGVNTAHTFTITNDDQNQPPTITLTSPTVSTVGLPAGVGLILETTVNDDGKPAAPGTTTSAWSKLIGPGTVTFGTPSLPNSTAIFSAAGSYVLRLTANDGALQTIRDVTVQVGGNPPFTGQNIAASIPAGSHSGGGSSYTVVGGGANISGTSDQFYFLSQALTGDGELRARITSMTGGASSAKAGVMFRNDTAAGARMAYMSAYNTGTNSNSWRYRATENATSGTDSTVATPTFPTWVRVVRTGNNFSGYTSTDGNTWTQIGTTQTITANSTMLAGLAVTSNSTSALCTAVFDNVTLSSWPANLGAVVSAGSDASAAFPAAATLSGTSSDDGKPTPPAAVTLAWSKVSGPGNVAFGNPAAAATTATFSVAGSYVLRLTANDGQVKTFDDMTATSTGLPTVTVAASDATATESGLTTGAFTLTRTGDTSGTLTVQFTVGGLATSGVDFTALGTSAVIDAGQASMVVVVTPLPDSLAEGAEDATLTLAADAAYVVGAGGTAEVTIDDLPMDAWRFAQFGANANNPAMAGDYIDWEGDGAMTLFEYAFGTNALAADAALPVLGNEPGFLTLTYRRALAATDLTFTVEETLDFSAWSNANPTEEILSENGVIRVIKARVPMGAGGQKAIHLRIARP